jgi:hypothetical protein
MDQAWEENKTELSGPAISFFMEGLMVDTSHTMWEQLMGFYIYIYSLLSYLLLQL